MELEINQSQNTLSWVNDGDIITAQFNKLDNYLFFEKKKLIAVLHDVKNNYPSCLSGYSLDGSRKFSVEPPREFIFSYLALHPEAGITVVCSSNQKIEGWYDWHYAINPETGNLQKWCPAM